MRDAVWVTIGGTTRRLADWARLYGISVSAICMRVRRGMSYEQALTTPLRIRGAAADHPEKAAP